MTVTNGYVTGGPSTNGIGKANEATKNAAVATLELYDNSEIEVLDVRKQLSPFIYTLTGLGRGVNGTKDEAGINEVMSNNFPEYKWKERGDYNTSYTVSAGGNNAVTAITFTSDNGLYAGLILRNTTTNERIRLNSATNNANEWNISRAVGETTAQTISNGETFEVIANAGVAGQASASSFHVKAHDESNYFQKILTTISTNDFERLSNKVGNYKEDEMARLLAQHMEEKERVALFGEKKSTTDADGKALYTARGVIPHALDGWTDDISSALTVNTFEEFLERTLEYGSKEKILLGSYKAIRTIRDLYRTDVVYNDEVEEVNLKFTRMDMNSGSVILLPHPMLNKASGYEDYLFVVDPAFVKLVYPSASNEGGVHFGVEGKTSFKVNEAVTNYAYAEGSYITYLSLELANKNAFGAVIVA